MLFVLNCELKIPVEYIIPSNRTQPEPQRIKWTTRLAPVGRVRLRVHPGGPLREGEVEE